MPTGYKRFIRLQRTLKIRKVFQPKNHLSFSLANQLLTNLLLYQFDNFIEVIWRLYRRIAELAAFFLMVINGKVRVF